MSTFRTSLVPFLLLLTACFELAAQAGAPRVGVTSAAIANALQQAGVVVDPVQIEMPSALTTATDHPGLHFTGMERLPDGRQRLRLMCRNDKECHSFFVTVRHLEERKTEQPEALAEHVQGPTENRHFVLRPGQPVSLVMGDSQMVIRLPVLVIDSGGVDQEIRVSSLDRRTLFHGVVVDGNTVKARLP